MYEQKEGVCIDSIKTFIPLNVSSKFAICGLPIRLDTYKTCSFGCKYCFSNCRKIMEFAKQLQVGNVGWVENKLTKVFAGKFDNLNFLDSLINQGYTWHCGGMSDPFQPVEKKLRITQKIVEIANKYNIHILFSTKSDTVYNTPIRNDLHTFQLSVTNINNRKDIEPNVPDINKRYKFYKQLKNDGFKVGIRIQPFIPQITTTDIIDMFYDADCFTIEGLKLVPQNKEHKELMLELTRLENSDFTQKGLLNLKVEKRLELYKPFIKKLESIGANYSIADNDLHHLGNQRCCCGDALCNKTTNFNSTYLCHIIGRDYQIEDVIDALNKNDIGKCYCNHLFTSNRQEGCRTVLDFYKKRFNRPSSPFSPQFLYNNKKE